MQTEASKRDALAELRYLLLGPERRQIAEIKEEIAKIERVTSEDVAGVLPQAVAITEREKIDEAMVPVIEESIGLSARRDPTRLGDVLFPVMGPAIRKAIREALNSMMQAINETIDRSVSPRAVAWRFESWKTGTSLPEIIFRHTMQYRVEQVFLIHRDTGVLLQHAAAAGPVPLKDADVVSGMLTAIQDFVRDSFQPTNGDALETMRVGELTVVVEQGPSATVAGVVRGLVPEDLRFIFQDALGDIQRNYLDSLRSFSGDTSAFLPAKSTLEGCLQFRANPQEAEAQEKKKHAKGLARLTAAHWIGIVLLIGLAAWGVYHFVQRGRWNAYLDTLRAEPGIVVTNAQRGWWTHRVDGLRDPLARDPGAILAASAASSTSVDSVWKPYQAMEPRFVLKRAQAALAPPDTASMQVSDDGVLEAIGSAPRAWIANARRLGTLIPGITRFKDDRLTDTDLERLERLREQVQTYNILFPEGRATPLATQGDALAALAADTARLAKEAAQLGQTIEVEVRGHTDSSGTEAVNRGLSRLRADRVLATLRAALPPHVRIAANGVATSHPLRPEVTPADRAWNRRVAVQVVLKGPPR